MGIFGMLGSGNVGNDGSLQAVLTELRRRVPEATVDALCSGPESVALTHGIAARAMHWNASEYRTASTVATLAMKAAGKVVDTLRIVAWVRRHDVVLVPGMGILEATVPLRPWGFPYSLFVLCAAGRLTGTRVALVCVGSDVVTKRATRWLIANAARLAHYRSYRDELSRDAIRRMGVDVTTDEVYPDLAFALTPPDVEADVTGAVGVGVMAYYGDNDDRHRADDLHAAYVDTMKRFVRWLVDAGREVRLFVGDRMDYAVVEEILADLSVYRPGLDPTRVLAEPATTLPELARKMAAVDTVVATRYHNVLCALKLDKPTLSIGYAAKNDVLMDAMGLGEFCQSARSVDLNLLIDQFRALERRREELSATMAERNRHTLERLERQFLALPDLVAARSARRQEVR